MKNFIAAVVFVFLLSSGVFAQKSDSRINLGFEGTWILEDADIRYPFNNKRYTEIYNGETLTISQNNDGIKIVKNYKINDQPVISEIILFLDKRGEENLMPFGGDRKINIKSESYSKKNSIVREYDLSYTPGQINRKREIYKLSDDGKTLTVRVESVWNNFPSLSDPAAGALPKGSVMDQYSKFTYRKE